MVNKYWRLIKNTLIFSAGTLGSNFIGFIMLPFFTRLLNRSEYGQIDIIITTITLLMPIFTLNIVQALFRFTIYNKDRYKKQEILSTSLIFLVISTSILIILYPILMNFSVFQNYYILFIGLYEIHFVLYIFKSYIKANNKIKLFAISDVIQTITFATSGIIFISLFDLGVSGYLLASLISMSIVVLIIFVFAKLYISIRIVYIKAKLLKEMIKYSIPLVPNSMSWWIMVSSDRYLLALFMNYSSAGIYSVANKFPLMITLLNTIFYQAWQISSIEQFTKKNRVKFYSKVFNYLSIVILFGVIVFSFIIKDMTIIMLGKEFKDAWIYIPFLIMGSVFNIFSSFYGVFFLASKKTIGAFRTSIYGALINIGVNILLIPFIGIHAASFSTFLGFFIMWVSRIYETKKIVKVIIHLPKFLLILFFSTLSLFSIYCENRVFIIFVQLVCLSMFVIIVRKEVKEVLSIALSKIKIITG